jgi:hypothetical protein
MGAEDPLPDPGLEAGRAVSGPPSAVASEATPIRLATRRRMQGEILILCGLWRSYTIFILASIDSKMETTKRTKLHARIIRGFNRGIQGVDSLLVWIVNR